MANSLLDVSTSVRDTHTEGHLVRVQIADMEVYLTPLDASRLAIELYLQASEAITAEGMRDEQARLDEVHESRASRR